MNIEGFQNKDLLSVFPDRTDAINLIVGFIDKALSIGDIETANLNFAKLIEAMRQQNINLGSPLTHILEDTKNQYSEFRKRYGLEYPLQFLPPEERQTVQTIDNNTFLLLTTLSYYDLPKSVLLHIDKVKKVSDWEELNFSPQKEPFGDDYWKSIKIDGRHLSFKEVKNKDIFKTAILQNKRITEHPDNIKALFEQGCVLDEFIFGGSDITFYIQSLNNQQNQDFEKALQLILKAIEIRETQKYLDLASDLEARLGNLDTIDKKFKYFKCDIDSAIYSGEIYNWFRGLFDKKEYLKIRAYIKITDEILDNLISGKIRHKIYMEQDKSYYVRDKENFYINILSFINIVDLPKLSPSRDIVDFIRYICQLYTGKNSKPIEDIADVLAIWNYLEESIAFYNRCLDMIKSDEKPKVKARIEKKINKIKTGYNNGSYKMRVVEGLQVQCFLIIFV